MQKTCGRLSPAVRLYAANFTVRVITMCQRDTSDHDGQPEKTRRRARGGELHPLLPGPPALFTGTRQLFRTLKI